MQTNFFLFSFYALAIILFFFALSMPEDALAARPYIPVGEAGQQSASPPAQNVPPAMPGSAPQDGGNRLFGTVEFQRPLNSLPGWLDVIARNRENPIFVPQKMFNKKTSWEQFQAAASQKNGLDQLRFVNSFWNGWPYREDMANWGKADYWAIPAQFLPKSGDCEDYAIIKYFTLRELGIPADKMRIVVLRDTVRNLAHAVLVVFMNNDAYVLDNLSNVVLSHKRLRNYQPQYSINENGRWAHIRPKGKK